VRALVVETDVSLDDIRKAQISDPSMAQILQWKEQNVPRPPWEDISPASPTLKTYWSQWDLLTVKGGVLTRRWESEDGKTSSWLTVLPAEFRPVVLQELHMSNTAAHFGVAKTLARVKTRFYWAGMARDVRSFIRQCDTCAKRKRPVGKKKAPLQQYHVGGPMERIALDVLGPLPESEDGNVYILVVGDYFTKFVEAYAIPDQTAETVADKLVHEFCLRYGFPLEIHSDQGRNFESKVFQEVCRLGGVKKTRTTPYNPKSDGYIERFNRTMLNALSMMIQPLQGQRDWDTYLPYFGFAYRSCVQETTQETPNMMMFGRELKCPLDLMVEAPPGEPDCETDYAEDLREKLREAYERVQHAVKLGARRQKQNYDRNARNPAYEEGEFVWLYNTQRKPGISKKLSLPWDGPYLVVGVLADVVRRIQKTPRSKPKVIHVDRLKPYLGPPLKPWKYEPKSPPQPETEVNQPAGDEEAETPTVAQPSVQDQNKVANADSTQTQESAPQQQKEEETLSTKHRYPRRKRKSPDRYM